MDAIHLPQSMALEPSSHDLLDYGNFTSRFWFKQTITVEELENIKKSKYRTDNLFHRWNSDYNGQQ